MVYPWQANIIMKFVQDHIYSFSFWTGKILAYVLVISLFAYGLHLWFKLFRTINKAKSN